ncbi:MAG: hypothetical protein GC159_17365 [Phycisphaera sp.]|nr:hypothetical protein [Phycisphaera sp.]
MKPLIITLLIVALAALVACETPGLIEYANQSTGESWTVTNPPKASSPASLTRGPGGQMQAIASAPREPDTPDTAIQQLWIIPVIGAGLIVFGAGTLTLRTWFPSVPISASLAAMGVGAALIAAPKIVQEAWWLMFAAIAAVALMYGLSWWDNHKKLKPKPAPTPTGPPPTPTPPPL